MTTSCIANAVSKIRLRAVAVALPAELTIAAQVAAIRPPERLPARPGEAYAPPFQPGWRK